MFRLARGVGARVLAGVLALGLSSCSEETAPTEQAAAVEVLVTQLTSTALEVTDELPGRVAPWRVAEIRPQVGGIIQQRLFEQGAAVQAGQPLFQINPAPFQADVNSAAAAVLRAQTAYEHARVQSQRLKPLVSADAISRQSYDNALAQRDQAAAELAQARAELNRRQLDLDFARITAPISGRIGATMATEGALVTAQDTKPLAVVQQIDKVYVDVRQPVERFEALRQAQESGNSADGSGVQILSPSGTPYPVKGRVLFSDVTVDAGTGNVVVRVEVDNPRQHLLPGMFVRARLPRVTMPAAILVPQEAVKRDGAGVATLGVVEGAGEVHDRPVTVGDVVDGRYVVLSGVREGETIVVTGRDRIQPGAPVKALPWQAAQR
ncbi:efflux RND transporter periplasmic adaptor subunit [Azospirillum sp. TSO35-2]|uniref:efflux RND transporter periplasmic adaptor subunit n=1 Tax=Azospirillum sp. TSO35-2 TaxID=716796 RepID=UPI000D6198CE|nr:efflux RND transporter periplasmic adaptor subunit [Azospirillum sp. TSO35-2]PWC33357.1 RND transporter [Azospirillum sp. TSO35-2]